MAENYTSGGYPVSGLERFVTGFESGYNSMLDIKKKSQELKTSLAYEEAANAKPKKGVEGDTSGQTREAAYDTGGTTGSGGEGGSGGSVSSFDPKQTGDGHVVPKSERIEYYNQLAKEYGLNAQAILMTIDKEGLHKYVGDKGKSFGDFQMYTGGGMGNQALDAGINIRDPNTWKEQGRFAIQQMAAHKGDSKWFAGQWHGPANFAPWAVSNFSNPDATPSGGGTRTATTAAPSPAASTGSSTPPAGYGDYTAPPAVSSKQQGPAPKTQMQGGKLVTEDEFNYPYASAPAAAPAPEPAPAPAAAIAPTPAPAPTMASGLRPPSGALPAYQSQQPPQQGAPGQQSAIGSNRPQAPPPPSVLAQLVQQNPYLPQQIAALRQVQQGAPQSALYSGFS
jgi:hypothetical protein